MKIKIFVLGNSSDSHASHIKESLIQAGATVNYLDTNLFPNQIKISWQPNSSRGWLKLPDEKELNFTDVHSVFWRSLSEVSVSPLQDSYQQQIAYNDSMSLLRTFIKACPARWVNSWEAYQFHKEKPLQLSKAAEIGVLIPATLVTNNPQQVIEFAQSQEKLIFKPVYGGAHTQLLSSSHLDPKRLKLALQLSPITLQEYIPGTNIRSYVIGESVYSAEIRSHCLDFREDLEAELIPLELPEAVKKQCLAITQAFKLEWTAIDWRRKTTGEYVFLEANPSPMFLRFENQTGFPLTQELVKLLMN